MQKIFAAISLILFAFLFSFSSSAHPGKTDSDGGHYDQSAREYHYHHGYPAHKHPNGLCPYDDTQASRTATSLTTYDQQSTATTSESSSTITILLIGCLVGMVALLILILLWIKLPSLRGNPGIIFALIFTFAIIYALLFSTTSVSIKGVMEFGYTFFINMMIPIICICAFRHMDTTLILLTCLANSILSYIYFMHDINLQGGSYSILSAFAWFCASFLFLYWIFRNRD